MVKYIIAIDGGGTKTLAVKYDINGNELKRALGGFSNFSIDEKKSKETIIGLLEILLKDDKEQSLVQMGIAGATKLSDKEGFLNELEKRFNIKAYLDTDALIGLFSTEFEDDEAHIMAIGGTGSCVMTYEDGKTGIIGGFGHLLGDEGSAYHLVISAIKQIIYESEHDMPLSKMSIHLKEVMGITDYLDIIEYVYNRDKPTLAKLSLEIQKAAKQNCPIARELLIKEALMLTEQIILAYKKFITYDKVVVSLRGSFSQKGYLIRGTIHEQLKNKLKNVRFDTVEHDPVYGAYILGKKRLNKEYSDGRH